LPALLTVAYAIVAARAEVDGTRLVVLLSMALVGSIAYLILRAAIQRWLPEKRILQLALAVLFSVAYIAAVRWFDVRGVLP
jgi:hypothetical protein